MTTNGLLTIGLIPGDGIGPDVTSSAQRVIAATGLNINWVRLVAGLEGMATFNDALPDSTIEQIREIGVVLKGPMETPSGEGYQSANVRMRQRLDLYANVRPAKAIPGVFCTGPNTDLTIVRQNTEGLYIGEERMVNADTAEATMRITRDACMRICRYAFELAIARNRDHRSVTVALKANILKKTHGLFLECANEVAKQYPDVKFQYIIVDACGMHIAQAKGRLDVIVTENFCGDFLSDVAAGMVGGLGLAASGNIGDNCAVFEAVGGTAPDIAGKGIANPAAVILASAMMLTHIGQAKIARRIEAATWNALAGPLRTKDLGGNGTTESFTDDIISVL